MAAAMIACIVVIGTLGRFVFFFGQGGSWHTEQGAAEETRVGVRGVVLGYSRSFTGRRINGLLKLLLFIRHVGCEHRET